MRFLIVDDSPVIRLVLQRVLGAHGECEMVADGEGAVEAHARSLSEDRPFDLICLDLGLPKMSGLEAVTAIRGLVVERALPARTRIIVITASADLSDIETARGLGVDGYLVKPVNKDQLIAYMKTFGLLGGAEESGKVDQPLEVLTTMCAADQLPVSVMANLIRVMAESIGRQALYPTASQSC